MSNWFDVDKAGLAKLVASKPKAFIVFELLQNAWDQNVTRVDVTLEPVAGSRTAQITVVDDQVTFGDIPANSVVTSSDTFKFREDRRYPVADFQIRWKLEYDDIGGNHYSFLDFPLR